MTPPAVSLDLWEGKLSDLLGVLSAAIRGCEPGVSTRVTTRSGFVVALAVSQDGLRRLTVSTTERPAKGNMPGWARYREDRARLVQHMGCAHWTVEPIPDLSTVAHYREPNLAGAA